MESIDIYKMESTTVRMNAQRYYELYTVQEMYMYPQYIQGPCPSQ